MSNIGLYSKYTQQIWTRPHSFFGWNLQAQSKFNIFEYKYTEKATVQKKKTVTTSLLRLYVSLVHILQTAHGYSVKERRSPSQYTGKLNT